MRVFVTRRVRFSAAHSYQNLPQVGTDAAVANGLKGTCKIHGHNYVVDLTCAGELDATGMVVNITEIDVVLKGLLAPLDQSFLEEDFPNVAWGLPTTENLARWIWMNCDGKLPNGQLVSVRVQETDNLWSEYRGSEKREVFVTKSYEFAAAHRLHSRKLSDEDNLLVFGKCNNPHGHGHNYGLDITIRGIVDERTGMACDIGTFDEIVNTRIINRFDHKHLNLDLPEFADVNPTSENIAVVIWNLLKPEFAESLYKVRVRETERNSFEYYGE
ncbi:MAG: 6-carboxytetrahydropterin synthase [Armatimonadota bacterium]